MANYLKRGKDAEAVAELDANVRSIVEAALADIDARGDAAVREMSNKFDNWERDDYRLSDAEIQQCLERLSAQVAPRFAPSAAFTRRADGGGFYA